MKQRLLKVEPGRHSIRKVPHVQIMQQKFDLLLQGR
jgi:hypothetical protein